MIFPFSRLFFVFAPDGVGGGSGPAAPSQPSGATSSTGGSAAPAGGGGPSPGSAPAASAAPSPSPAGGGSSGIASQGTGTSQPAASAPSEGVLDALRQIGLGDFAGQHQNDHAALQALAVAYRQLQQVQPMLPYAQQFAQHAGPFQQWMQQQAAQQQAAAQKKPNPFGLPEFDQRLLQMVKRNEQTGQLEALPGAPFDAVQQVTNYAYQLRQVQDQFWADPTKFLGPVIQDMIKQHGSQLVQQGLGGYQEQTAAQQFVQQNTDWLHARDASNQLVRDPMTGAPVLSEWGKRFAGYVQQAEQYGVRGVQAQRDYALGMTQRDALAARQQAGQQTQQQSQQQFLNQATGGQTPPGAARNANLGGSVQPPSPNGTAPSQNASIPLRERLRNNFKANGFQVPEQV